MAMETQDIIKGSQLTPSRRLLRCVITKQKSKPFMFPPVSAVKPVRWRVREWNDIRDEVGHCVGVYDNPADLSAKSWTADAL